MERNEIWLKWAVKLQSIAQEGLFYGKDLFDRERYERIRDIAAEMISYKSEIPVDKVKSLFCNEIDTRRLRLTAAGRFLRMIRFCL